VIIYNNLVLKINYYIILKNYSKKFLLLI